MSAHAEVKKSLRRLKWALETAATQLEESAGARQSPRSAYAA